MVFFEEMMSHLTEHIYFVFWGDNCNPQRLLDISFLYIMSAKKDEKKSLLVKDVGYT